MQPFIKALKLLYTTTQRRSNLTILRYARVADRYLYSTDLDHHLTISNADGVGMADIGILTATGDLSAAIRAGENACAPEDFPVFPELNITAVAVPITCLRGITPVAGACATDISRAYLQQVHINPAGWAEATDGHRLYRQAIPPQPVDFMVDPLTLRLLDALPDPAECMVWGDLLYFAGVGWSLFAKRYPNPYPLVEKVISREHRTPAVTWDLNTLKAVKDTLTKTKPYWKDVNGYVKFTDTEIITRNKDLNHIAAWPLGRQVFTLPDDRVLGMNAKYLLDILAYVGKRPVEVTADSHTGLQPVIFQGADFMALQMPLRTKKEGQQTRDEALAPND